MANQCKVAILGATGLVGQAYLDILAERKFPLSELYLLASEAGAGKKVNYDGKEIEVLDANNFDFSLVDIAFFSAGGPVSKHYAPIAAEAGCVVVDNTSEFRYEKDIPLVVPEVNSHRIADYRARGIIANPNCSTIQLLLAIKPIYDAAGIERMHVVTYQAVSGAGRDGTEALAQQNDQLPNPKVSSDVFPAQIAANVIPQAGAMQDDGHSEEEMKLIRETHKIMEDDTIEVVATAARVPVFNGHSEAVHITTKKELGAERAIAILASAPGVTVMKTGDEAEFRTAAELGERSNDVYVSRVRNELFAERGLCMWVVADNIRKGAALNSVQIAEHWLRTEYSKV